MTDTLTFIGGGGRRRYYSYERNFYQRFIGISIYFDLAFGGGAAPPSVRHYGCPGIRTKDFIPTRYCVIFLKMPEEKQSQGLSQTFLLIKIYLSYRWHFIRSLGSCVEIFYLFSLLLSFFRLIIVKHAQILP